MKKLLKKLFGKREKMIRGKNADYHPIWYEEIEGVILIRKGKSKGCIVDFIKKDC
ncbi:MAG TPA: hypothetical protein IAA23_05135 [Candidatus Helicobacter avistercoris]|nr:hypothetical protein [Candidatus Helicobacter avistercoris]